MKKFFQIPHFVRKKIISSHLDKKSSVFAMRFLTLRCRKFQKRGQEKVKFRRNADLLICNPGNFLQPQWRIVSPLFSRRNKV